MRRLPLGVPAAGTNAVLAGRAAGDLASNLVCRRRTADDARPDPSDRRCRGQGADRPCSPAHRDRRHRFPAAGARRHRADAGPVAADPGDAPATPSGLTAGRARAFAWSLDLYGWHVPLLYQWAIKNDLAHALEHACLLWFGILLWLALLGPLPKPRWFSSWARLGYVVVVRFVGAILANALIWAQTVFYPVYKASDAARGLNPLSDQNLAGALMMFEQIFLTVGLLAWLFFRAARQDEDRQSLLDFAAQRNLPLSEQRAALAATAGTADQLRERLIGDGRSAAGDADPLHG